MLRPAYHSGGCRAAVCVAVHIAGWAMQMRMALGAQDRTCEMMQDSDDTKQNHLSSAIVSIEGQIDVPILALFVTTFLFPNLSLLHSISLLSSTLCRRPNLLRTRHCSTPPLPSWCSKGFS
jgi:hypothetical protein